jgi:hypothetical protein
MDEGLRDCVPADATAADFCPAFPEAIAAPEAWQSMEVGEF